MSLGSFNTKEPVLVGDSGPTLDGSSKTATAARCMKKYQLAYVRKIRTPRAQNPSYFTVGACFGATRAAWFSMKFASNQKAWLFLKHAAQKEAERQRLPVNPKDEAFALALFQQYMDYWLARPLPRPVATEFKVGPHKVFDRTGSLDDLSCYQETGWALAIGECKTTSGDIASCFREHEFGIQTLQYQALYMLENPDRPVTGHLFDITHKPEGKGKKPKFARMPAEIRLHAVKAFIRSTTALFNAAKQVGWDSSPVRSYQCTYVAGRAKVDCEYKNLCMHGESASARYVLEDGSRLKDYKPVKGKEKMPWE